MTDKSRLRRLRLGPAPGLPGRQFQAKLVELGAGNALATAVLATLPERFTRSELEAGIARLEQAGPPPAIRHETIKAIRLVGPHPWRGSHAPIHAGAVHLDTGIPQMIETADFLTFAVSTLSGSAAQNKGMALFPRQVRGEYLRLSRKDRENLYLARSTDLRIWNDSVPLYRPSTPWELLQATGPNLVGQGSTGHMFADRFKPAALCVDGRGKVVAKSLKWLLVCWTLTGCHGSNPAYRQADPSDGPLDADIAHGPSADGPVFDMPRDSQPLDLAMSDLPADAPSPDATSPDAAGPDAASPDAALSDAPVADVAIMDTATEPAPPPPPDVAADLPPDGPGPLPTPVAYWRLDASPDNVTPDDLGRNPGMLINGASLIQGGAPLMFANPYSLALDGDGDYVSLGVQELPGLNEIKSVSLWFWTSQDTGSIQRKNIISIENIAAGQSIHLGLEYGAMAMWRWASIRPSIIGPTQVTLQRWHHIGYTFDGQTHTLYLDGMLVGSTDLNLNAVATAEVLLGLYHPTQGPNERFRGRIDDVRIYDRALSAGQVRTLAVGSL